MECASCERHKILGVRSYPFRCNWDTLGWTESICDRKLWIPCGLCAALSFETYHVAPMSTTAGIWRAIEKVTDSKSLPSQSITLAAGERLMHGCLWTISFNSRVVVYHAPKARCTRVFTSHRGPPKNAAAASRSRTCDLSMLALCYHHFITTTGRVTQAFLQYQRSPSNKGKQRLVEPQAIIKEESLHFSTSATMRIIKWCARYLRMQYRI